MREIKFRIWEKDLKRMEIVESIVFGSNGMPIDCNSSIIGDECILMQYTGLKDNNGKEIYEGDILKKMYGTSIPVFEVGYDNSRAIFVQLDGYNEALFRALPFVEIIGNIYENPELIK